MTLCINTPMNQAMWSWGPADISCTILPNHTPTICYGQYVGGSPVAQRGINVSMFNILDPRRVKLTSKFHEPPMTVNTPAKSKPLQVRQNKHPYTLNVCRKTYRVCTTPLSLNLDSRLSSFPILLRACVCLGLCNNPPLARYTWLVQTRPQ
jgi:hypothetical protein